MANYNTSPQLFRNAHASYRQRGIFLVVADGHVIAGSDGVVARFDNDEKACECLLEAGYVRDPLPTNIVFRPPTEVSA